MLKVREANMDVFLTESDQADLMAGKEMRLEQWLAAMVWCSAIGRIC